MSLENFLYNLHFHMFSYRRQQSSFSILGMAKLQSPPVPRQRTVHRTDNRVSTSVMPGTPHSYTRDCRDPAPFKNWTKHQSQKVSSAEQLPTSAVRKEPVCTRHCSILCTQLQQLGKEREQPTLQILLSNSFEKYRCC